MTEAFQFERQLMGTFTSLIDGFDQPATGIDTSSSEKIDLELDKLI